MKLKLYSVRIINENSEYISNIMGFIIYAEQLKFKIHLVF